ncbi:hypothetical protein ACHGLA_11100 [Streptomyces sp. YH02]|uniref:hypothetical protein n=1 Tax=Streptomyces sp. YH02 TaxID=3256999 RepID=UPI003756BA69
MPDFDLHSELSDAVRTILDIHLLPHVYIDGLEVTQSIQYYKAARHLTDPADRGPDNSVRLIANKAAWVRVYVRTRSLGDVPGLTGTLEIQRHRLFKWEPVTVLSPQAPGAVTVHGTPVYTTERATLHDTLNFVIPAAEFWGDLRLVTRITDADGTGYDTDTRDIDATLRQTLRVRGILVSYSGPSTANPPPPPAPPPPTLTLPAPTLANLAATSARALRAMPVQATGAFTSAGTLAWTRPLDDARSCPGCCSTNWNALLAQLGTVRTNDGNRSDVVYYGLLPTRIPLNVPGCGADGLGAAAAGDQMTLLHEIGHGYGFAHTPCGNAGPTDPSYPTYDPYAPASIGEYGLDIADGTIMPPASTSDYMSYCGPSWSSLYHYNRLILHPRLGVESLRDDLAWRRFLRWRKYYAPRDLPYPDPREWGVKRLDPIIAITGIVRGPGRIEVLSVARVSAMGQPPGHRTALTARLVGNRGETLSQAVVHRLSPRGEGRSCSCADREDDDAPYVFEVYVPDVGQGTALEIGDGEDTVWERHAPDTRPEVGGLQAEVTEEGLLLHWESGDPEADAWAQWSSDDGTTWQGLATGLSGGRAELSLAGVPDGDVLIRVLVHDGFSTAVSEPTPVHVPSRPPEVAILHPEDEALLLAGGTLQLSAAVTDAAGQAADDPRCRWLLDDQEVGRGLEAWTESPGPGRHRLTLQVGVGEHEVERSVSFRCLPDDELPDG